MLTPQETKILSDRAMQVCSRQSSEHSIEDTVNEMLGLYLKYRTGRPDIAAGYKQKFESALNEWRATRGW